MYDGNSTTSRGSIRTGQRGVSPVIGVVLLLAVALIALTILQTTAIPILNSQAEFEHSQRVQSDMVELDAAVGRTATLGQGQTVPVDLGVRYQQRLLFINPPPASGTLRTADGGTVTIENARAAGETGDYWDGTVRTFRTQRLVYDPAYNEYDAGPNTVYEPWLLYNAIDDRTLPRTETDLVEGRRISLVALDGNYSRTSSDTVGVGLTPTSGPVQTVTVSNESGPLTLTIPTQVRNDTWATLLEDELDQPGTDDRYVTGYSCENEPPQPCGNLTLTFESGSYELALGEVAVGSGPTEEGAVYLTDIEGNATAISEDGRQRLVVEARDRYDNPVSGVSVTSTVTEGPGSVRSVSSTTDTDGRAVFVYEAPEDVSGTETVRIRSSFGNATNQERVQFDLELLDGAGTATAQGSAAAVSTVEGTVDSRNIAGGDRGREVTFDISASEAVTVTGIAVTTQNELEGRPYEETDTTVGGSSLPTTIDGTTTVALRDIIASENLPIDRFVDPSSPDADILVTLEFADGSSTTIGIA